jgi:hypothetical protein
MRSCPPAFGLVALFLALACSSGSGSEKDGGGDTEKDSRSVGSGSSDTGTDEGSCPSESTWVYSEKETLAGGTLVVGCTGSLAPEPPAGFTTGHCPTSGLSGCCVGIDVCGKAAQCYYNEPSSFAAMQQSSCEKAGSTWQDTPL